MTEINAEDCIRIGEPCNGITSDRLLNARINLDAAYRKLEDAIRYASEQTSRVVQRERALTRVFLLNNVRQATAPLEETQR